MNKAVRKIIGCLALFLEVFPVFAQQEINMLQKDSLNFVGNGHRRQEMLQNYVKLLESDSGKGSMDYTEGKNRFLVMPVIGIHPSQLSYGGMIGLVKRTGVYLKAKYSFSKVTDGGTVCDDEGFEADTDQKRWYTGQTEKSRMAVTVGVLQRLWPSGYMYGGVGYGWRKLSWETVGGDWLKNKDHSYKGVEVELGGIVRIGILAVSAGIQTNSFQYMEANIGIGVLF